MRSPALDPPVTRPLPAMLTCAAHPAPCRLPWAPQRAKKETYKSFMGKFGKAQVQDVLSAAFISVNTLVTGIATGELLMCVAAHSRRQRFQHHIPLHMPAGCGAPACTSLVPVLISPYFRRWDVLGDRTANGQPGFCIKVGA